MTRSLLLTVTVGLLLACGSRDQPPTSPVPIRVSTPKPATTVPVGFARLVAATQRLTEQRVTQDGVVEALRALSAVLRDQDAQGAADIDALATKVGAGDSPMADLQRALRGARAIIAARLPTDPIPDARDAYVRAARAIDALAPTEPLGSQDEYVQTAFAALTNIIAALHGARSVPELARPIEVGHVAQAFRDRIDRARDLVGELAVARTSVAASDASQRALRAIAEVVEVAPLSAEPTQWRSLVLAIRFSALRLRGIDSVSQDRSDHLRTGLLASTAAIERMTRDTSIVSSTRKAAEAIDPHGLFVFQRAAIQDAFRTHVEAFEMVDRALRTERRSARR